MKILLSCVGPSVLMLLLLLSICTFSDCYDPLDPNGNITATLDIHYLRSDGYVARLVIADLMPDAPPVNMSENCSRGGLISAWAIDPLGSFPSFEMTVVSLDGNSTVYPPAYLTLLAPDPGYTCGPVVETTPTVSSDLGGQKTSSGLHEVDSLPLSDVEMADMVQCTDHMCPARVQWHVKNNYMEHWRVKMTISNYSYRKNYSHWNVLVQHPGFKQNSTIFSFNSTLLPTIGFADEVALFWGLQAYNNELLQADQRQLGSVSTEILFEKDGPCLEEYISAARSAIDCNARNMLM